MTRRKFGTTLMLLGLLWMIGTISGATFSDQITSAGNELTAGTLYMSVDGQCGTRQYGGGGVGGPGVDGNTGCQVGSVFSIDGLVPGATATAHQFAIQNLGSLTGTLSADITAEVDAGHPACLPTHFSLVAGPPSPATLDPNDTATYPVEVGLLETAPNACQGASLTVSVAFTLVQA